MIYRTRLNKFELAIANKIAEMKQSEAVKNNRKDQHGFDGENGLEIHGIGACGEIAFAKLMGVYWDGSINTFGSCGDVGEFQVRTTDSREKHLIIRPGDKNCDTFVSVRAEDSNYYVMGYQNAAYAKRKEWLKDTENGRPPMYLVPDEELRDVTELVIAYHENAIRVLKSRLGR